MGTEESLAPEVLLAALQAGMDSAGIGCTVVVNREGPLRRAYSNTLVARILGMTVEELQRTPPLLVLTPEERVRLSKMREGGGNPVSLETKVTRGDGSIVPVEVSMGIVPLDKGHAIVAFLRDLTPRLEM